MEEKENIHRNNNKFNWKLVIIATVIIGLMYIGMSVVIEKRKVVSLDEMKTTYCYFKKYIMDDPLPRTECGFLKIYSHGIDEESIIELEKRNIPVECSDSIDTLPKCNGTEYHFTQFPLNTFCPSCNVEGYVCGAYFITYYANYSLGEFYLENIFTEPYIMSEEMLMARFLDCDIGTI